MKPVSPPSNRLLRWGAKGVRAALWVVGGLWLLAGLTLALVHGLILPRLATWTPELEALATRAIGIPVRIDAVEVERQGLLPVLRLGGVHLLDNQGRQALSLGEVTVVASVPSLWRLGVEQIHIERPVLDIRRRNDGVIEVAGVPLSPTATATGDEGDSPVLDWVFAQDELVLRNGQLRWTDEWERQPPVELEQVDLVLRNQGRRHKIRLDATPADGLGGRLTWMADFRSPLLSLHPGRWLDWRGTVYAHLPAVNLAEVAAPTHLTQALGLQVYRGQGALRWWVDIEQGQIGSSTLDVAMTNVQARFAAASTTLDLATAQGRLELAQKAGQWTLDVPRLSLTTRNGLQWQGNGIQAQWTPNEKQPAESTGRFQSGFMDLGALGALASALPLPPAVLSQIEALQPTGQLDQLLLSWRGDAQAWSRFAVQGTGSRLSLRAAPEPALTGDGNPPLPQRPGFRDAGVRFSFDEQGGQAQLSMRQGELVFPGVFEESSIPIDSLSAELRWRQEEHGPVVSFSQVRFANADLAGQASGQWQPSDPAKSPSGGRFPGVLKLDGTLQRAQATRVHRYLPLVIPAGARHYVRDAIVAGESKEVQFRLHGDLWNMPFSNPADGDFRIAAKVKGVDYAYVPTPWQEGETKRWPVLRKLEGELVFARNGMAFQVNKGLVAGVAGLQVRSVKAQLPDFSSEPTVEVQARIDGPLADTLAVVRSSPLSRYTQEALDNARGQGNSAVQFELRLPLNELRQTTVKGQVQLRGNDLTLAPDTPPLRQTRATIDFSEQGFQIQQATSRVAGGEIAFSGGLNPGPQGKVLALQGKGTATAEGLRAEPALGPLAGLAIHATGQAAYQLGLDWDQYGPQWTVRSDLDGLRILAPAPLDKPSDQRWPLVYVQRSQSSANKSGAGTQTIQLDVETPDPSGTSAGSGMPLLRARLQRPILATGSDTWTGTLALGRPETAPARASSNRTPESGWHLRVNLHQFDADAWSNFLFPESTTSTPAGLGAARLASVPTVPTPQTMHIQSERLRAAGQWIQQADASLQRQGNSWNGQVTARELEGRFAYQPAAPDGTKPGKLQANLRHLHLRTGSDPGALPQPPSPAPTVQRADLPALELDIANLRVDERQLGRLQLQASHQPGSEGVAQWHLDHMRLTVPEAELTGTGSWKSAGGAAPDRHIKRTSLDFELQIRDSEALLQRFGMSGVLRGGKGQITGQLQWQGMPYALHSPSLSGQLHLDLGSGQFLKADPGVAKLLGVLSLQSLPRRLTLDFSDVFADGFAFDSFRGDATIAQGLARTDNLRMKGPHATVNLKGQADIAKETQDIRADVLPELNAGTASLLATVVNPAVGLGTLLAQTLIRQPLAEATKQQFHIHGTWTDPVVDRVRASAPTEREP